MKKRRILSVLLLLVVLVQLLCLPAAAQVQDLQLKCNYSLLMEAESGQILYEQQAYEKAYPASMTKVMTGLLVLDALDAGTITLDTMIPASQLATTKEFADESTANLLPGELMSVEDMMYCLLMPSANDCARALAEYLGGSLDAFVEKMIQRAE